MEGERVRGSSQILMCDDDFFGIIDSSFRFSDSSWKRCLRIRIGMLAGASGWIEEKTTLHIHGWIGGN